jgi:hypothetical protein
MFTRSDGRPVGVVRREGTANARVVSRRLGGWESGLQVLPHLGRGGEAVKAVEIADRLDGVELLRDRLDPRARLLPRVPGERKCSRSRHH